MNSPTEDSIDDFLGAVETNITDQLMWSVTTSLNNYYVNFKLNTGTDVIIKPETVFNGVKLPE